MCSNDRYIPRASIERSEEIWHASPTTITETYHISKHTSTTTSAAAAIIITITTSTTTTTTTTTTLTITIITVERSSKLVLSPV